MKSEGKIYTGRRDKTGSTVVRVIENGDSRALPLRLDLFNHSPTGFEWGYGGSGPAQLALAILVDVLGNDRRQHAVRLHQDFKWAVIGGLPRNEPWQLTERFVVETVERLVLKKLGRTI